MKEPEAVRCVVCGTEEVEHPHFVAGHIGSHSFHQPEAAGEENLASLDECWRTIDALRAALKKAQDLLLDADLRWDASVDECKRLRWLLLKMGGA